MRKVIFILSVLLGASAAMAAEPEVKTIYGDLNGDGVKDKVVVETPCDKANMKVRDDGYVYNFNQPVLYIYFGKGKGYKLFKKFDTVLPRKESEDECLDMNVTISKKGVLRIAYSLFYSMGSYGTNDYAYQYRYQNGDFYLIGEDSNSASRNTGEYEKVSVNYLTHKKQVTTGNQLKKKAKTSKKTSSVPKKSLEKLGKRNLKVTD